MLSEKAEALFPLVSEAFACLNCFADFFQKFLECQSPALSVTELMKFWMFLCFDFMIQASWKSAGNKCLLEKVEGVAPRACCNLPKKVEIVTSRACCKLLQNVESIASKTDCT